MLPTMLIFIAYVVTMPLTFAAWAAMEIKTHPNKYN